MLKNLISAAAVLALASGASATVIYSTSFEAPTFAVGNLNGQNGWIADTGTVANTAGGAHTGTQFARMTGANIGGVGTSAWQWQGTSSLTAAQLAVAPIVRASVWVSMSGTPGTRSFSAGLDCYDTAVSRIGQILINLDGSVSIIDGLGTQSSSAAGLINPLNYHKLTIEMNYATGTQKFFVDGIDSGVTGLFANTDFGDADFRGIRGTGTGGAAFELRADDYILENEAIPAPASLALMGMGLIAGGRRRR